MTIGDILKRLTKVFVLGLALLFLSTYIACADDIIKPRFEDKGEDQGDDPPNTPDD